MNEKSTEELHTNAKAKGVITPKRKYFNPEVGEVEATSEEEAARLIEAQKATKLKDTKVGDA
jgi:hypothetical protein